MKRLSFCLLLLFISSCDKKYTSNIPDFPVEVQLDLTFEGKDLFGSLSHIRITPANIHGFVGANAIGFGGVLIYHGFEGDGKGPYYAFDASCPHEAERTIRIEMDESNLKAVCPECGSEYDVFMGTGSPVSGPANQEGYFLKSYKVTLLPDNKILIRNRKFH